MTKVNDAIFKAYDIRGVVATDLTDDVVICLGKALGTIALDNNISKMVVGYDGRLTSPSLAKFLIDGIMSTGCDVINIGEVATPIVYFANYELQTYSGVMITGSHNPPEYNGFKMVVNKETLASEKIQEIKQMIIADKFRTGQGQVERLDMAEIYLNKITEHVKLNRRVSIVVDAGNGVAGKFAPTLYRRLGCKVYELFCDVDGNFPNHHPDPSRPHNLLDLIEAVKNTDAEFGLAFDGDGDRVGIVTKEGNVVYPDRQMMIFSADILERHPGAKIIFDVKSSRLLKDWIIEHGGEPIMAKTGHSLIKAKIRETGAILAGEMSGHIFFNDHWRGIDDGIYAGARLIEILSKITSPSELLNALPNSISTPEINVAVAEGEQHAIMAKLSITAKFPTAQEVITIDGLRAEYNDGFGLVRASNTTPVLVLRFESDTEEGIERIKAEFRSILAPYVQKMEF